MSDEEQVECYESCAFAGANSLARRMYIRMADCGQN
jgi:hypothetical protein